MSWSFPPKCMESGDYMRRVLQTADHITYVYGNLLEMHKCCCYLCTEVSRKHFGETAQRLFCYLWRLLPGCLLHRRTVSYVVSSEVNSLTLQIRNPTTTLQMCAYIWGSMMTYSKDANGRGITWHAPHDHDKKEKWPACCEDYVYSIC